MNTTESWTNFERHNGGLVGARDRFEDFCAELLNLENSGLEVHRIDGNPGDDGLDVLVLHPDGLDIYQCKFFRNELKGIQWRQIRDSFETARKKNTNIHSWYLCLPKRLTSAEMKKVEEFIKAHNDCGFRIGVIDGDELICRAEKQGIAEKWFAPFQLGSSFEKENLPVEIWRASREYFRVLCSGNNKFGGLKIFENLFPEGVYRDIYYEPLAANKEGKVTPVQKIFYEHEKENLVLMGEGGIGKTTFLAHQLSVLLDDEQMPDLIPIYIELNRCPAVIGKWYSSRYGKTNYITRYVKAIMDGGEFESYTTEQLKDIEKEFQQKAEVPRYLLLLDGFNEVNIAQASGAKSGQSIRELLRNEIGQLAHFTNVRIVLTTRRMSENYLPDGFNYITLRGLGKENIRDYLTHSGYSDTDIAWIEVHPELMGCLKIPLFLCMFACRNRGKQIKPLTRGEILYHFFHRGTPFYSEKRNIKWNYAENIFVRKMLMFSMDFILPTIGYKMNDRGIFQISKTSLLKEIKQSFYDVILSVQDSEVSVFSEYETETESLADLKKQFLQVSPEKFLDAIVNILGVMNRDGMNGYSFIHHHIRDYFAAYYIIQRMREAIAIYNYEMSFRNSGFILEGNSELTDRIRYCLEPVFYEIPDETVKSFIGETLGEHRNIPVLGEDGRWYIPEAVVPEQTVLRQVLDMYRYSSAEPKYLISNIVEIFKRVRKTVAGERFDGLDLRNCRFYETICSVGMGEARLAASFKNCNVGNQTFLFEGHIGKYRDFFISSRNPDRILTLGDDEQVCVWDRATHRMLASYIVGSSVAQEGSNPEEKIIANSTSDFLTRYYEYMEVGRGTYIRYVRKNQKELLLSEEHENRIIDDMRFSPLETCICGVWGGDTLRIFHADSGKMYYKYSYSGKGRICHAVMPQEDKIILHVRLKEEIVTKNSYWPSEWIFYCLDMADNSIQTVYRYESGQKFNTQANEPLNAFDVYQKKCLLFTNHQVVIIDFEDGKINILEELSDDIIPERGEFLDIEGSRAAVYWGDTIKIYDIKMNGITSAVHCNLLLEQCIKFHIAGDFVYFIDENGNFHQWNLKDDMVKEQVLPTVKLDIKKIHADTAGHILAEYSNNCILIIDENSDCLLSTFYEVEPESKVEVCTYLEQSNQFFVVLHGPDYEQVILYDPVSGKRERIEVTFINQMNYRAVLEENHILYIAFDKKMIAMDMDTGQQEEVWHAKAGEEFFDFEVKNGVIYLLSQWAIACRMPKYFVYARGEEGKYEQKGTEDVLYIKEEEIERMVLEEDIGFFVTDPVKNKEILTARGVFLHPSEEINLEYFSFGRTPEESTRVFYYVKNYDQHIKNVMIMGDTVFITQNNHAYVTILKEYSEVEVYGKELSEKKTRNSANYFATVPKDSNRKLEQKYSFTLYDSENDIINLYHAVIGTKGKVYCSTSGEKLIKVCPKTGEILKQFSWLPGIILTGCDFFGTELSDNLKGILEEHGARVDG